MGYGGTEGQARREQKALAASESDARREGPRPSHGATQEPEAIAAHAVSGPVAATGTTPMKGRPGLDVSASRRLHAPSRPRCSLPCPCRYIYPPEGGAPPPPRSSYRELGA
jgi:hypothetical protein